MTELRVPGDKSISHRALLIAALAGGESRVRGVLTGGDLQATASVLRALGVRVPPLAANRELRVRGVGARGMRAPRRVLDCANSGTSARLLLGVLAGQELQATLTGDDSLRRRPMRRVTGPLSAMGARFDSLGAPGMLPLRVAGGALRACDHRLSVASAQVKSALLLAGVTGGAPVRLIEPGLSRDHTERMLQAAGCSVTSVFRDGANRVRLTASPAALDPVDVIVPGDFSSAAFPLALALLGGVGEGIVLRGVGLNPTRTGLLPVLRRMNARVEARPRSSSGRGEPAGDLVIRPSDLVGTEIRPAEIPGLIDEVPVLAVLAARARGATRITGAGELRVKESDRLGVLAANLANLGAEVEELPDGLVIEGSERSLEGSVETHGDHRIAMAFGVLGALAGNAIIVDVPEAADVSYPGFWKMLEGLSAQVGRASAGGSGGRVGATGRSPLSRGRACGPVIVIDGPAGSGKSTTARAVARRLGCRHLDSGALYRALTLALLESGRAPDSLPALTKSELNAHPIRLAPEKAGFRVELGARSLTSELRSPEVDAHVSAVARIPAVRAWLLGRQRRAGAEGWLVADGRDMGTVVFPEAEVKVFLVAGLAERARRRLPPAERDRAGAVEAEAARLRARDQLDEARGVAPLRKPPGAVEIDGTRLSFDEQVEAVLAEVRARTGGGDATVRPPAPG